MKRTAPVRKSATGIKATIMAASLAVTLGGWGILAVGQVNDTAVAMQQSPATAQTSGATVFDNVPAANQTTLRQAAIPPVQQRPIARTRSSR